MKKNCAIVRQKPTNADNRAPPCIYLCNVIPEDTACVADRGNPYDPLRYLLRGKEIILIGAKRLSRHLVDDTRTPRKSHPLAPQKASLSALAVNLIV